jgi:hypothetical protein
MDQKILSELGDYLLAHREEIISEWLQAVEQNPDISSGYWCSGCKWGIGQNPHWQTGNAECDLRRWNL